MLSRPEAQRRHRVLVTDVDQGSGEKLQDCLRVAGFHVTRARGHTELCLKLLTWRPDVVLLDAAARVRETLGLANLIRRSARQPVPTVFICDHVTQAEPGARVVLRSRLFTEVVAVLRSALVDSDEAPQPLHGLPRTREA